MPLKLYSRINNEIVEVVGMENINDRTFFRIKDSNGICKFEVTTIRGILDLFSDLEESFDGDNLIIDYENEVVRTNCGDYYYDYGISFKKIKELAKKIGGEE